jgi:hypothetical protein
MTRGRRLRRMCAQALGPAGVVLGLAGALLLVIVTAGHTKGPPSGKLSVTVVDGNSRKPTPVRIRITDAAGKPVVAPAAAIAVMYGKNDGADGYAAQPDGSFYVAGPFEITAAPGAYTLVLSKGNEYLTQRHDITVQDGKKAVRTFTMRRWIDMRAKGWHSTDGHIHIRRSPREDSLILGWTQAEDIHVGVMLWMGDQWGARYTQYAFGAAGVFQDKGYLLTSGQPRTPEIGHTLGFAAADKVRFQDEYYLYDKVFDRIRELGGVAGYAHQAVTYNGARGITLDGLRGKVQLLELAQFCSDRGPLVVDHYYRLLDLGFAVTAVAGSDFPWCGEDHRYGIAGVPLSAASRIGNARFYVHTDGPLSYEGWKAGLHKGQTFVTTGPIVTLTLNGRLPGDRLDIAAGSEVEIVAEARGHATQIPLDRLEVVGHGEVLFEAKGSPEHLMLRKPLRPERGIWLAARAYAGPRQIAHTTPIYVTVGNRGFHNPKTSTTYLDQSDK